MALEGRKVTRGGHDARAESMDSRGVTDAPFTGRFAAKELSGLHTNVRGHNISREMHIYLTVKM